LRISSKPRDVNEGQKSPLTLQDYAVKNNILVKFIAQAKGIGAQRIFI